MRLHEYQAKQLFHKYEIPIPKGQVTTNAESARLIAESIGGKCVIKAQILAGGRGKAGGIRVANTSQEARELATHIMGLNIHGMRVHKVLVEEAVKIQHEIYLAISIDRENAQPILIASSSGGVDIEETAEVRPDSIQKIPIDPLIGIRAFHAQRLTGWLDIPHNLTREFTALIISLWKVFSLNDALLVEINPLVISEDSHLLALDAKIEIDDNALFRHPDIAEMRDVDLEEVIETEARKFGLTYIRMKGNVGCLVNGAGLAMVTMDLIQAAGGEPANFLDVGGGASSEKVSAALKIMLSDGNIKSILVNIFGGITRCDEVAKGILAIQKETKITSPIVVRLEGTNAEIAGFLLKDAEVKYCNSLDEAAKTAVKMAALV